MYICLMFFDIFQFRRVKQISNFKAWIISPTFWYLNLFCFDFEIEILFLLITTYKNNYIILSDLLSVSYFQLKNERFLHIWYPWVCCGLVKHGKWTDKHSSNILYIYIYIYMCVCVWVDVCICLHSLASPSATGQMLHRVNFKVKYSWFELRVLFLFNQLPYQD